MCAASMHHRGLQILYQDAKQVVVNKPVAVSMQGRPTSPGGHAWRKALAGEWMRVS